MKLTIKRFKFTDNATVGELFIDGVFQCFTLEDKVREVPGQSVEQWKINGKTAIPVGCYTLVITFSNRFQRLLPEILKVPGFTGIRIHSGNTFADTEGCILVGNHYIGDNLAESRKALDALCKGISLSKYGMTMEISQ